eukprot:TRINITY_DN26572_c0_g1_i10.p1 TRINITY_DN26572_c0_g1~~TRINITY_DN26572_c0_g1_i10.p1  ORF type:complete len:549 (-),score=148.59 TRINITY_DN26572_c0_g1_i10:359-2005(-)
MDSCDTGVEFGRLSSSSSGSSGASSRCDSEAECEADMMMMGEGELSSEEVEEGNSMEPDEREAGGGVDNQVNFLELEEGGNLVSGGSAAAGTSTAPSPHLPPASMQQEVAKNLLSSSLPTAAGTDMFQTTHHTAMGSLYPGGLESSAGMDSLATNPSPGSSLVSLEATGGVVHSQAINSLETISSSPGRSQALEDELMLLRLLDHHNKRTGTTRDTPGMYMPENDANAGGTSSSSTTVSLNSSGVTTSNNTSSLPISVSTSAANCPPRLVSSASLDYSLLGAKEKVPQTCPINSSHDTGRVLTPEVSSRSSALNSSRLPRTPEVDREPVFEPVTRDNYPDSLNFTPTQPTTSAAGQKSSVGKAATPVHENENLLEFLSDVPADLNTSNQGGGLDMNLSTGFLDQSPVQQQNSGASRNNAGTPHLHMVGGKPAITSRKPSLPSNLAAAISNSNQTVQAQHAAASQVAASIVASISTEAVNTTLAQINASVDTMIGQAIGSTFVRSSDSTTTSSTVDDAPFAVGAGPILSEDHHLESGDLTPSSPTPRDV